MAACKHYEICGLTDAADSSAGLCILHSRQENKDREVFTNVLRVHRETKGDRFSYMVFPMQADFSNTTFSEMAIFSNTTFSEMADFSNTTFSEMADFSNTTFSGSGEANFFNMTFSGTVFFTNATFPGKTNFIGATFSEASFTHTVFSGEVSFAGATFSGTANFAGATFSGTVYFTGATFSDSGEANFLSTTFSGEANFLSTLFPGKTNFIRATFAAADFTGTIFSASDVTFRGSRFHGRALFAPRVEQVQQSAYIFRAVTSVDLRALVIESPESLRFQHADFRTCRFLNTDLRKVGLTDIVWPKNHVRWRKEGNRHVVYDEIAPLPPGEQYPWEELERLYRELKQNHDDRRNYPRAGDFHYGEKEMQRRNPRSPWSLRLLLSLYWLVSGYGERFLRPLLWIVGLLIVGTGAYLWWGLQPKSSGMIVAPGMTGLFVFQVTSTPPTPLAITNIDDWLNAMNYSLRVMTLLRPDDLMPVGVAKFVYMLQSLLGPLFLGLFALAVRQRLKH